MITIHDEIAFRQDNFWNNIHFHPTDAIEDDWGGAILDRVAADGAATTVRMYAMLEDIVTRGADGQLCYDFTLNDQRIDAMIARGFHLLISYSFIPPCISSSTVRTNTETAVSSRYKGKFLMTEPPHDWAEWEEICYTYTAHLVGRYGLARVSGWYLQCYNEPDVSGFFMHSLGTTEAARAKRIEAYCKMYEAFARGTMRVSDRLRIGGPAAATHPMLDAFLAFTSRRNLPVRFACAHSYGTSPQRINDGQRPIDAQHNLDIIRKYLEVVQRYYPDGLELVIDEWGASNCGFCNLDDCPQLVFRETEAFAAFYVQLIAGCIREKFPLRTLMICLSGAHQPHQLPGKFPEFNGFRSFFTEHFIPKPIYGAYVLARKLGDAFLRCESEHKSLTILPTRTAHGYALLLSNASPSLDPNQPTLTDEIRMEISGTYRAAIYRIDRDHTNPYQVWQQSGGAAQLDALRQAGTLCADESIVRADGTARFPVSIPANGVLLIELTRMDA